MTLRARCGLRRAGFDLDVDVELPGSGVSAIFGPSGAGKTSLLRCIAGLERGARGRVQLGDEVWQDDAAGLFLPPHRRKAGYVFQEPYLLPHLTVRENLGYAARRARRGRIGVDDAVEWLGVGPLLDRRPGQLSGGERQRSSVAQVLTTNPRLLLMDEPLSSLDRTSRKQILPYLEQLQGHLSVPIVYVSHSIEEILRLATHMVWLVEGHVGRSGALEEVMRDVGFSAWLGDEAGVLVPAEVEAHDAIHHLTRLAGPWGPIHCRRHSAEPGSRVGVRILARDVSLGLAPDPESSILNEFRMRIVRVSDEAPGQVLVELAVGEGPTLAARVTTLSCERLGLAAGREVYARIKAVALAR